MAWADRPPDEQAALLYCAPRGIPLSVFLGRVVYPGDPMWLEDDVYHDISAALDWLAYDRSLCGNCGRVSAETVGEDEVDKWNAEITGYCDGCRALHRVASVKAGRDDLDPLVGARYRVWRDEEGF